MAYYLLSMVEAQFRTIVDLSKHFFCPAKIRILIINNNINKNNYKILFTILVGRYRNYSQLVILKSINCFFVRCHKKIGVLTVYNISTIIGIGFLIFVWKSLLCFIILYNIKYTVVVSARNWTHRRRCRCHRCNVVIRVLCPTLDDSFFILMNIIRVE